MSLHYILGNLYYLEYNAVNYYIPTAVKIIDII